VSKSTKIKIKKILRAFAESMVHWVISSSVIRALKKTRDQFVQFEALVHYHHPTYDELLHKFDWVCPSYKEARLDPIRQCEHTLRETRIIKFKLMKIDQEHLTKSVLKKMEKQNLRPAMYEELLAFNALYPHQSSLHTIVALGSVSRQNNGNSSPYLFQNHRGLCLAMDWHECAWDEECRFLVVPKKKRAR